MNSHSETWTFNNTVLQAPFSSVCGQYCVYFLLYKSRGFTTSEIVSKFLIFSLKTIGLFLNLCSTYKRMRINITCKYACFIYESTSQASFRGHFTAAESALDTCDQPFKISKIKSSCFPSSSDKHVGALLNTS